MSRSRIGTRRSLFYSPNSRPLNLPAVGPFASRGVVRISSLTDRTVTTNEEIYTQNSDPLQYRNLTISGGALSPNNVGSDLAVFLWVDKFQAIGNNTFLTAYGQNGSGGDINNNHGGPGANGTGGGGGGGVAGNTAVSGGAGASAPNNGSDGSADGSGGTPGTGGSGFASYIAQGFAFPLGGDGGAPIDGLSGAAGAGVLGAGGGGGGGSTGSPAFDSSGAGGGGGGGGGLLCVVCNEFIYPNVQGMIVRGGSGGSSERDAYGGAGGGGGVVYVATRKKLSIGFPADCSGGTGGSSNYYGSSNSGTNGNYILYEIKRDLTLVEHANWNDTWNNL